jgi:hypothetical protein
MNPKKYKVQLEVAGRMALFKEPSAPISFPIPPRTAAEGMFASIARWNTAHIRATVCRICAPVRFMDFAMNNCGPLRKPRMIDNDNALQIAMRYLYAVCFQLEGVVVTDAPAPHWNNQAHALQAMFQRRLRQGCSFRSVHLGTSECGPDYVGPWRPETKAVDYNEVIHGFPTDMWSAPLNGEFTPRFGRVEIKNGVLLYD